MSEDPRLPTATAPGDAWYAVWSYHRLLFLQPHIAVNGLWKLGECFYIVCPDLGVGTLSKDGMPILEWFSNNRAAACPIKICREAPDGSIRVPDRTAEDLANLRSEMFTTQSFNAHLALLFPMEFPKFYVDIHNPQAFFYVERKLSDEEAIQAHGIVGPFLANFPGVRLVIEVTPKRFEIPKEPQLVQVPRIHQQGLVLLPARLLPQTVSKRIINAVAEDDDFWVSYRAEVMGGASTNPKQYLGPPFEEDGPGCLIDASVWGTRNIRTSLTLYQHINLILPIDVHHDAALSGLGVTERELLHLAELGRVRFLLPQPVTRYSPKFVEMMCELPGKPYAFTRHLAAATVVDSKRRFPLLHPSLSVPARRAFLEALQNLNDRSPEPWREGLIGALGESWATSDERLHALGAMGEFSVGFGRVFGEILLKTRGIDRRSELMAVSSTAQWAGALNASIMPIGGLDAEVAPIQDLIELCASSYSGAPRQASLQTIGQVEELVEGLLELDSDVPVMEVARAFSPSDIIRFAALVRNRVQSTESDADVRAAVRDLRAKAESYRKKDKLARVISIYGPYGCLAGGAIGGMEGVVFGPLLAWFLYLIFHGLDPNTIPHGELLEWVRSMNASTTPDVVLVHRLRHEISGK